MLEYFRVNLTVWSLFTTKSKKVIQCIIIQNEGFTLEICKLFETITIATNYCNK